ncbi:MAG: ATP-binding cassette domain-containing protein [Bryobacterales bacterium]|nr:ATP-binding cassette domain-containing protein [Bryobacterales bacterium]
MSAAVLRAEAAGKQYTVSRGYGDTKRYHRAFGPLDLTIRQGERIALARRSGAGKSTLGRCLAGLEPLTEGRLVWSEVPPPVKLVFQDSPAAMNPRWSIADILAEPLRIRGLRERPAQLAARLEEVASSLTCCRTVPRS